MFLSEKNSVYQEDFGGSEIAEISLGGADPAVMECDTQRKAAVFGPGGIRWVPKRGQTVLVVKAGSLGEEACIAGAETEIPEELQEGELCLYAGEASICLKNDGRILITGQVTVNGEALTDAP